MKGRLEAVAADERRLTSHARETALGIFGVNADCFCASNYEFGDIPDPSGGPGMR
jgi:hypothetical protein